MSSDLNRQRHFPARSKQQTSNVARRALLSPQNAQRTTSDIWPLPAPKRKLATQSGPRIITRTRNIILDRFPWILKERKSPLQRRRLAVRSRNSYCLGHFGGRSAFLALIEC
jgi:hypothetical protein